MGIYRNEHGKIILIIELLCLFSLKLNSMPVFYHAVNTWQLSINKKRGSLLKRCLQAIQFH